MHQSCNIDAQGGSGAKVPVPRPNPVLTVFRRAEELPVLTLLPPVASNFVFQRHIILRSFGFLHYSSKNATDKNKQTGFPILLHTDAKARKVSDGVRRVSFRIRPSSCFVRSDQVMEQYSSGLPLRKNDYTMLLTGRRLCCEGRALTLALLSTLRFVAQRV